MVMIPLLEKETPTTEDPVKEDDPVKALTLATRSATIIAAIDFMFQFLSLKERPVFIVSSWRDS